MLGMSIIDVVCVRLLRLHYFSFSLSFPSSVIFTWYFDIVTGENFWIFFTILTSMTMVYLASVPAILAKSPTLEILASFLVFENKNAKGPSSFNSEDLIEGLKRSGLVTNDKNKCGKLQLTLVGRAFYAPFKLAETIIVRKDI